MQQWKVFFYHVYLLYLPTILTLDLYKNKVNLLALLSFLSMIQFQLIHLFS
jgi:hypothetical protein